MNKNWIGLLILVALAIIFTLGYFSSNKKRDDLLKRGKPTIGVTYRKSTIRNTIIFYRYKVGDTILEGSRAALDGKCPGYYYKVLYLPESPEVSYIDWKIPIEDSIGKAFYGE
jgi:hypothetical protein